MQIELQMKVNADIVYSRPTDETEAVRLTVIYLTILAIIVTS